MQNFRLNISSSAFCCAGAGSSFAPSIPIGLERGSGGRPGGGPGGGGGTAGAGCKLRLSRGSADMAMCEKLSGGVREGACDCGRVQSLDQRRATATASLSALRRRERKQRFETCSNVSESCNYRKSSRGIGQLQYPIYPHAIWKGRKEPARTYRVGSTAVCLDGHSSRVSKCRSRAVVRVGNEGAVKKKSFAWWCSLVGC